MTPALYQPSHLKMRAATSSLALTVFCSLALTAPLALASNGELLAHRAVYELSLDRADQDSGVQDASGLFVFQVTGSACSGWNVISDIVLTIEDSMGGALRTETQYRAFEDDAGEIFTFQTNTRTSDGEPESVAGAAERDADGNVTIRRFGMVQSTSEGSAETLFPNQLTHAILNAAADGQRLLFTNVFDGSHEAGLVQPTTAVIGPTQAPSVVALIGAQRSSIGEQPVAERPWEDFPVPMQAWPVRLSYFDPLEADSTPSFEVSYTLDSNGVSDDLRLDYGSFSLRGELAGFAAFLPTECTD
jgi:hypothetical protein